MAASGFEKFKILPKGARSLLRSDQVRADLQRRAESVQRAAQGQTEAELTADSYTGKGRAGATVIGVPLAQEQDQRILGGAIDAAGH